MSIQIGRTPEFYLNETAGTSGKTLGEADSKSFEQLLNTMLKPDSAGKVNEEQMYSAVINERLTNLVGEDAAERYQTLLAEMQIAMQRGDGFVPVEQAADAALEQLTREGVVSKEQAALVAEQAFRAAQIDNNHNLLYDSLGTTSAVTAINSAIIAANAVIEGKDPTGIAGSVQGSSGDAIESSGSFVGGDGFLFKPVSESNGNLVILLPSHMQEEAASVYLVDQSGNQIEKGQSYGPYDDGRPLFRFDSPGKSYPENLTVQIHMDTGELKEYTIPDPEMRWE